MAFRERVQLLNRLINSLVTTKTDFESVELLLACDEDDPSIHKIRYLPKNATVVLCKRSEHFVRDYINLLARMAQGRWIMNINDDSFFKTKGWDTIIDQKMSKAAEEFGDDFILGLPNDGLNNKRFSCWPIVSQSHVEKMGYFFFEGSKVWGADHIVADMYRHCRRHVRINEVLIDHISVHTGKAEKTENFYRFQKIHDEQEKITSSMIQREIDKLKGIINEHHKRSA